MKKIEIFENERAAKYNKFVETWIPNYHYFLDCLPNLLEDTISKKLLVVGCGTGNEIERFIKTSNEWEVLGIDPSKEMINQAIDKLKQHKNVILVEGLISDLAEEKKYDAATLLLVLHFLEDNGNKANLLKDIAKRLVSGSKLIILDITGDRSQIKENLEILRNILPKELNENEINMRLNRIENDFFPISEERLITLVEEAGFEKPTRFFQSTIYMGWIAKKK